VVERNRKGSKDELAGELSFLFSSKADVTLDGMDQVEKSICVEHVMLALKENLAHVLEESQKVRHLLLAVEVRDKLENSLGGSEGILPDFHS